MSFPSTENFNWNACVWFDVEDKRNTYASIAAGLLFFVGWWLMIGANVVYPDSISGGYYICGIIGTISLFMINLVPNSQLSGSYSGGHVGPSGARIFLFIGFVLGFASVIASMWIFLENFLNRNNATTGKGPEAMAGVELLLQNIFIFTSSLIYKFGRVEEQF